MSRAIYLYCVVRSSRKPPAAAAPPGLPGGEKPSPVKIADRLWLVTASVPLERYGAGPLDASLRDLEWVGAIALAHEAVVEHFARAAGTVVIPMKLFTMFSTDARAAAEMRKQRRDLERLFDRIEGCEEWGVRVTRARPAAAPRQTDRPASGTAFLAARKQARDQRAAGAAAAAQAADAAYESLVEIAREGRRRREEPPGVTAPVLDAAFLVPARRRARFQATAQRLARELSKTGARMTLTGPWPPYNFVGAAPAEKNG